ncbi:MAG TPA: type II toxin-antitoxin system VapC family toxin [Candidatus Aquilonibacter sp.]|nr:type II toxin-antitoxin system VapC family toxin [Candidatus Aquilonibacter sp.]
MTVYVDTSFLVSLYLTDKHSDEARQRVRSASALWLTPLHWAEWFHAVAQHIFTGEITSGQAAQLYAGLGQDRTNGLWTEASLPDNAFDLCTQLALYHGPKIGTRTLDSLHVASAIELGSECFWTFDHRQAKLAETQGLKGIGSGS